MFKRLVVATGGLILLASCQDDLPGPTGPDPETPPTASLAAAAPLSFRQVTAGLFHSCGVTTDDVAYCWGRNFTGELGDGRNNIWESAPVPVAGGLRFRRVAAGESSTCGVTPAGKAYCWGFNVAGQLGDGSDLDRVAPSAVQGGHAFLTLASGASHTCGITTDNRAYCWGANSSGQLGIGTVDFDEHLTPIAVSGRHAFRHITAGAIHTCGITTADRVLCWGGNEQGQVGDSTEAHVRALPTRLAGGRFYSQVDAGRVHTCAVTRDGVAFCWGNGREGQLGNGKTYLSFWPRRVAGSLRFLRVSGNSRHTCGATTDARAYCWGGNFEGMLGDGTTTPRLTPTPVTGSHRFDQVVAGNTHTCARTTGREVYCWGNNEVGQLGDGTEVNSLVPVGVAAPS